MKLWSGQDADGDADNASPPTKLKKKKKAQTDAFNNKTWTLTLQVNFFFAPKKVNKSCVFFSLNYIWT